MNLTKEQIEQHCDMLAKSGSEHGHQRAFFAWLAMNKDRFPNAHLAFAIPNGGLRDKITAAKLKAEGVKSGVPDIFYPVPNNDWDIHPEMRLMPYHGLFIEMKAGNGKLSKEQSEFLLEVQSLDFAACICWSWRAAAKAFEDYATGKIVKDNYI